MRPRLPLRRQDIQELLHSLLGSRFFRLLRPVLLAGLATGLLFASVDRSQPWTLMSAWLGVALLGVVLACQLVQIVSMEQQLLGRARQLALVSEMVSALNSSTNVGSTLEFALERLLQALGADAGAIWLPAGESRDRMVLVEQRGLPDVEAGPQLLAQARAAAGDGERLARHVESIPTESGARPARCLTVRMGWDQGEFGYVTLYRWKGEFTETDEVILSAMGCDLGGALRSVRLISDARRVSDRDPITGLLNHASAYQRLHSELERHAEAEQPLALMMLDLDNFKLFNDTYGHSAGDEVLKRVSGVVRRCCREADLPARFGGDEFLVILPNTTLKQAIRCAEKLQSALARERFRCQDSASLPIGFSYGIAAYPADATDAPGLVSTADANLFQSRSLGGNRITASATNATDNTLINVKGHDLFRAMVEAIDNKDGYTRKHSEEVTEYSLQIARALGLGEEMLQTIQVSGILHDVGKIGVPDAILRKPGRLTDEEFDLMRQHPVFGALIVGSLPGMEEVVLGVRHHHERYDGMGYPDRLAGEAIPLIGRIMAVADAYSAMTTSRPYRKGLTERQALGEIRSHLGTQFDPEIGELFARLREEMAAERPEAPRARRSPRRRADAEPVPASAQA